MFRQYVQGSTKEREECKTDGGRVPSPPWLLRAGSQLDAPWLVGNVGFWLFMFAKGWLKSRALPHKTDIMCSVDGAG